MRKNNILYLLLICLVVCSSCSMTKNIPDDDQLFVGLKPIVYVDERKDSNTTYLNVAKAEVEAALATTPNGSLFGSSYYTVPWSFSRSIYNKFSKSDKRFAQWLTKSFGKAPVLMSQVNPALRASVARSVLRNYGYFRADVTYKTVSAKNPKKARIAYTVRLDSLFTIDSLSYVNFPDSIKMLIDSTTDEQLVKPGAPFNVTNLENERFRIGTLLRNNGYYRYNSGYASYLADTFAVVNKAQVKLQLANGLDVEALKKWYIGRIDVRFRKSFRDVLTDSIQRRFLTIHYNGDKSPIRPGVVLRNLKLRSRQPYSYAKYQESVAKINATGVFSSVDLQFNPRQNTDTLDLQLNCTFDKPYDFYFETNAIGRTNGRFGPEARIGISRRNVFHGAEKVDLNLHGAYEWQHTADANMNSYEYGADLSIEFPRIIAPFYHGNRRRQNKNGRFRPQRFINTPTTIAKISSDIVRRPGYYKMHIATGEWTYRGQTSERSRYEFSPLTLKYQFMNSHTAKMDSVLIQTPYLVTTMSDYFIPKMRFSYVYTKDTHPLRWEFILEEAGNITALSDVVCGRKWNTKGKTLFKNPYAQFVRVETDLTKTWNFGNSRSLVAHMNAGAIYSFGNATNDDIPFSELFYVGGANSIRAFTVRSIGPGSFTGVTGDKQFNYMIRNGNVKFVCNLEYRTRLYGNLHGAVFLDAGNVWCWDKFKIDKYIDSSNDEKSSQQNEQSILNYNEWFKGMTLDMHNLFDQIALGTGVGLRYDLGFLVVRVDWGLALHAPYDTGKSGYLNIGRFRDAHTLHLAIGYPF